MCDVPPQLHQRAEFPQQLQVNVRVEKPRHKVQRLTNLLNKRKIFFPPPPQFIEQSMFMFSDCQPRTENLGNVIGKYDENREGRWMTDDRWNSHWRLLMCLLTVPVLISHNSS